MSFVIALMSGILFGVGLTVSQMVSPNKVLDFLDIAAMPKGGWDPSLLMVFAGALPIMFVAFQMQKRMQKPAFETTFAVPNRTIIDKQLVSGAAIFGIGWGMAGLCPGPAVTALPLAGAALGTSLIYVVAMFAGVLTATFVRDDTRVVAQI
jgi:uncharacterized membrane protein YedE/YeeE